MIPRDAQQIEQTQYMSVTEAMAYAERLGITTTRMGMINWLDKFSLGHRLGPGGHWVVEREKLGKFLREGVVGEATRN
jgi:hypothetical protein